MSDYQGYNFCPNCGAVTKDGVCTACGHKSKGAVMQKPSEPAYKTEQTVFDYTKTGVTTSFAGDRNAAGGAGKKGSGVAMSAIISVLLIVVFSGIMFAYSYLKTADSSNSSSKVTVSTSTASVSTSKPEPTKLDILPEDESDNDAVLEDGYFRKLITEGFETFYLEDETEEAAEDGYDYSDTADYYVYDDYIRTDFGYKILYHGWEYGGYNALNYGANAPENVYIYCSYPSIDGKPDFQDMINETIREASTYICDMYEYDCEYMKEEEIYYGDEHVYVTYMDEDVLSVLAFYDGYFANDSEDDPKLVSETVKAFNFNMADGKELKMPKLAVSDDKFIEMFVEAVNEQNDSDILEDVGKIDLLMAYNNGEFEWFYTPIGVEIVYNFPYNYGFYSCTMDPTVIFK